MKILLIVISSILLLASCSQVNTTASGSKTQSLLNTYKDSVSGFGIVALIDNGQTLDTAAIGDAFDKQALSTKNRFCIGSCTKMFTSVIVLKLQEKGLLNIADSIYHYLPRHAFIDSTITIQQLLNHTSGIADFLDGGLMNDAILQPNGDFSDKVMYANIDTADFEKGTRYRYCNTNYFLLAKIIEKLTDKSWEMNIQEQIIQPLQLKNTFPYYSTTIENLAHPIADGVDYHTTPKRAINAISVGSGCIVSDLYDLNTFIRALLIDKTVLSQGSLDAMMTYYTYKNKKSGLGMFEDTYDKRPLTGHTGRQLSYITYAYVDLKTKESFIVINNNMNDAIVDRVFEKLCQSNEK